MSLNLPAVDNFKNYKPNLKKVKGKIDKSITRAGDFITLLSVTDRTIKKKARTGIADLTDTLRHPGQTDVYGTLHPAAAAYTLSSNAH